MGCRVVYAGVDGIVAEVAGLLGAGAGGSDADGDGADERIDMKDTNENGGRGVRRHKGSMQSGV